jgi:hypothetical protein
MPTITRIIGIEKTMPNPRNTFPVIRSFLLSFFFPIVLKMMASVKNTIIKKHITQNIASAIPAKTIPMKAIFTPFTLYDCCRQVRMT